MVWDPHREGVPFGSGWTTIGTTPIAIVDPSLFMPTGVLGAVVVERMQLNLGTNSFLEVSLFDTVTDDVFIRTEQEELNLEGLDLFQGVSETLRVVGDNAAADGRALASGFITTERTPIQLNPPALARNGRFCVGSKETTADNNTQYTTIRQVAANEFLILDGIHVGKGASTEASIVWAEDAAGTNEEIIWSTTTDEIFARIHRELYQDPSLATPKSFLLLKNRKAGAGAATAYSYVQGRVADGREHDRVSVYKEVSADNTTAYLLMLTINQGERFMVENAIVNTASATGVGDQAWIVSGDSPTAPSGSQLPIIGSLGGTTKDSGVRGGRVNYVVGNDTAAAHIVLRNTRTVAGAVQAYGYIDGYYLTK